MDFILNGSLFYKLRKMQGIVKGAEDFMRNNCEHLSRVAQQLIKERGGKEYKFDSYNDLLTHFLREIEKKNSKFINYDIMIYTFLEVYYAGVFNTSGMLIAALEAVASDQDLQKRVHEEIDEIIGKNRHVSMMDCSLFNYVTALIAECRRHLDVANLGLMHSNHVEKTIQEKQKLAAQMIEYIIDLWRSNILNAAAKLDIADYLAIRPMTADELAHLTHTHAEPLYRFLRAFVAIGYAEQDEKKRFRLTSKGSLLRNDVPYSVKHIILFTVGDRYTLWSRLEQGIKTGKRVTESLYGVPFYERIKQNPEELENFCKALKEVTRNFCQEIPDIYDFNQFEHIIDVAGNDGEFLSMILKKAPNAIGTVYDLEPIIEKAKENLAKTSVKDRCYFENGDFLESVPAGGDCYIIKSAFDDHNDEDVLKVLKNIRKQMKQNTKLLICELILAELNQPDIGTQTDLFLFLLQNGKERTREEWNQLTEKAGLKINNVFPTSSPFSFIIEVTL
ncbi:methyltransferase-like protein [Dinothrombium tinctorium]|uniref:Acetylserotonin O-methyltransferase n=1 Tax=Dinothrombium tinctorium TaxID=1965070 RepID=A0A3S3S956_9ACAR|nr:methyltransferase-like protein [Dinothrombium tinctorium]